jgi:hypothetical protein
MAALVHRPYDLSFELPEGWAAPDALVVDLQAQGPDGESLRLPLFWAGGRRLVARLAAPSAGLWRWQILPSPEAQACGLSGREGAVQVAEDGAPPVWAKRGRLRVSPSGTHLITAAGEPFLWLSDTWWFGFVGRLRFPEDYQTLIQTRVAQGYNVIKLVAGPLPDFDRLSNPFDGQQANDGGLPWQPGWTAINPAFYDEVERRLLALLDAGLTPCLVGMWGYFWASLGAERVRRHWRYLVARFGAWPVLWCVAGETLMPTYSNMGKPAGAADRAAQLAGWSTAARDLRALDAYHNLITTHPEAGSSARQQLEGPELVDLDWLQSTHIGFMGLGRVTRQMLAQRAARPVLPWLSAEGNYEG